MNRDDRSVPGDAPRVQREALNLRLRLRQAPNVARRAVRHPSWLLENLRLMRLRRAETARRIQLDRFETLLTDERTAVLAALSVSGPEYERAQNRFWAPEPDTSEARAIWDARASLQSLVSVVVLLVRPTVMVETGVARGYTTAIILAAMAEHGHGHLHSVDLPALEYEGRAAIGDMVPDEFRGRWTLEVGPSRTVLPRLVRDVAPIDVFLHDADHTYASQLEEYRTAWPALRPGGVLISDDVQNEAFVDFAAEVGARPFLIGRVGQDSAIGILSKSVTT